MTDRMTISAVELSEILTARGDPHSVEAAIRLKEAMEWIRSFVSADDRSLHCAFCGAAYPDGTPETKHERLTQHIMECPEHPIRKVKANLDAAETRVRELEKGEIEHKRVYASLYRLMEVVKEQQYVLNSQGWNSVSQSNTNDWSKAGANRGLYDKIERALACCECVMISKDPHARCGSTIPECEALTVERDRLAKIIETHDLCHNLHGKVDARAFADGCAAEQRKLYGCAPDADELEMLKQQFLNEIKKRSHSDRNNT